MLCPHPAQGNSESGPPSMLSEVSGTALKPQNPPPNPQSSLRYRLPPCSGPGPRLGVGLCCKMSLRRAQKRPPDEKRALPVVDITPASQYNATGKQHGGFQKSWTARGGSPETWPIDSDFLDTSDEENALAIRVLAPPG